MVYVMLSVFGYSFATALQLQSLLKGVVFKKKYWLLGIALAFLAQSILIKQGHFDQLMFASQLTVLFVCLGSIYFQLEPLGLIIFPFSIFSLLHLHFFQRECVSFFISYNHFHLILSKLALGVLALAGIQAGIFFFKERSLRAKASNTWFLNLPSLESMEVMIFRTLKVGFFLLSFIIISSVYLFSKQIMSWLILSKLFLAGTAWCLLAALLWGNAVLGWRGRKAVYSIWFGVILLLLLYFGSRFFLLSSIYSNL